MILHDAMPLLTTLHIDNSSQMNLKVTSRFRDIKEIHINSLLDIENDDDGYPDTNIDLESKIRLVPFLSRFDNLERVLFWGKDVDGNIKAAAKCYYWEGDEGYPNDGAREKFMSVLDSISGAYNCGALPNHLKLSGLCCPDCTSRPNNNCEVCIRACKSFPLESVAEFECRGSSASNGRAGRPYGLDVCIERATLESIVESRPGGSVLLHSEDRLLRLLGSGRRYVISPDEESKVYIVKYEQEELDEIKRVIEYAGLNVKKLSMESTSNSILKSFTGYNNGSIPPREQRYVSDISLDYLRNQIGLQIDKTEIERPLDDLMKHIHQFVWILMQGHEPDDEYTAYYHSDIEIDSLKVVRHYLEGNKPSIQQVIEIIPCLVNFISSRNDSNESQNEKALEAAHSLMNILVKGTDDDRKKITDAEVIPLLVNVRLYKRLHCRGCITIVS